MNLKNLPFRVYGDVNFRGDCPKESSEQITFFNRLRYDFPETFGVIALHPRNEQQLIGGQHRGVIKQKAEGMAPGASDIIIPGSPAFVCEMKRKDHTKSKWQEGQQKYLLECLNAGCFVCVALGWESAWEAFNDWRNA